MLASLSRGLTLAPRVDVYTHLACSAVRHEHTVFTPDSPVAEANTSLLISPASFKFFERNPLPHTGPTKACLSDPAVQASAASLQAILNTSIGLLSVVSSGYWGSFGDRFGRRWVSWLVVLGFISQDLVFIFCAAYGTQLHLGQYTLLIGSILEGIFGSWATFNAATNAYISDCSAPGSRAKTFALFAGLFFLGVSLGPAIGSIALRYGHLPTMSLFYISASANLINLLHIPLLIPESLSEEARKVKEASLATQPPTSFTGKIVSLFRPLGVLLPRKNALGEGDPRTAAWDVDVTLLGVATFCGFLLNVGLAPPKYLYAEHMFGWDAAQLGFYVTVIASCRAAWLMLILPALFKIFKPRKASAAAVSDPPLSAAERRALHLPAMIFDLRLARLSIFLDVLASACTALAPNTISFMIISTMSSLGGGALPSMQSIMVSLMADSATDGDGGNVGSMFGAISMLQALGQNIISPVLFGEIYVKTVAFFPGAIFVSGAILLLTAFISLLFVSPHRKISPRLLKTATTTLSPDPSATPSRQGRRKRGRSRTAKDLRYPSDVSSMLSSSVGSSAE
ncbi:MFS general substrate transporter [Clavulina sp. PMI_390]|nr:MFS general substrate transporter [Clavulina sp. PMI_390]